MNLDDTPETYANMGWVGMRWDTRGGGGVVGIAVIAGIADIARNRKGKARGTPRQLRQNF
jgi:hypothetical protein